MGPVNDLKTFLSTVVYPLKNASHQEWLTASNREYGHVHEMWQRQSHQQRRHTLTEPRPKFPEVPRPCEPAVRPTEQGNVELRFERCVEKDIVTHRHLIELKRAKTYGASST